MKIKNIALGALLMASPALTAQTAAQDQEPIITLHTNYYEIAGSANAFTIYMGATEDTYVDVDCGFGTFEAEISQAYFDEDQSAIVGSPITCTVSQEGIIKIYGDASKIDYIDFAGSYITSIEWPGLTNVEILNMEHNALESLDISHMEKLMAVYLSDNPFDRSPLVMGTSKPALSILEMAMCGPVEADFDIARYPALRSFTAYSTPSITKLTPSGCPGLLQLSVDGTSISEIDVTKNPSLLILNVSETKVTSLDLSKSPLLTELYIQHEAWTNNQYKFTELDVTHNPELQRLFVNGNRLTSLDLSKNTKLVSFFCKRNNLTALDFDPLTYLTLVDVSMNNMNFATLPLPRNTFSDYAHAQYPMQLNLSYAEGSEIDLSGAVLRQGGQTSAALYSYNTKTAEGSMLDDEYFTYADGKITLNKVCEDSVYLAFKNTLFPEIVLNTTPFMVKKAEDMGKPIASVTLKTGILAKQQALKVGFRGATAENPVEFWADFGDGVLVKCTATTMGVPAQANVNGERKSANTTLYVAEGTAISALEIADMPLNGLDVTEAPELQVLNVTGCRLASIDLKYNSLLRQLDLSGNNLSEINLSEPNDNYIKTRLGNINLADNKLTSVTLVDNYGLANLDMSNNLLTDINLVHATNLKTLNVSNNRIAEVNLQDCESLQSLDIAGNMLTEIAIPDYAPLSHLDVSGNALSYCSLPAPGVCADYKYAPQQPHQLPERAPMVNLEQHNYVHTDNSTTEYAWYMASDNTPVADGHITAKGAKFHFTTPNLGKIYCVMTHPAFPDMAGENALRTTAIATAERPTKVFATVETAQDGNATLSLASAQDGHTIYIDWSGDDDLEQYILGTSYTLFQPNTHQGQTVRFYSYEDQTPLTVFSIRNTALKSADLSGLNSLKTLTLAGTGMQPADIKFPSLQGVEELSIDGNNYTEMPAGEMPALRLLSVNNNKFTHLDVSAYPNLANLYASGNQMESIKLDNPKLWELTLANNSLGAIDLAKVPSLQQVFLSGNNLTSIDLSNNPGIKILTLDGNRMDFTTLPIPSNQYYLYHYNAQQPVEIEVVDGRVDLSRLTQVGNSKTNYAWYIDSPFFLEDGTLDGENLYEGEEYTLENGVTTFLKPFKHIMCVMTNSTHPDLYLTTNFVDAEPSGIENVAVEDAEAVYYDLRGIRVTTPTAGNIYIRRCGNKTSKVMVK